MIIVVDDKDAKFPPLKDYLEDICQSMGVFHEIQQVTVRPEDLDDSIPSVGDDGKPLTTRQRVQIALERKIESLLEACHTGQVFTVLVFDNHMQLSGGAFFLERYIAKLWNHPRDAWEAKVPIIVWVQDTSRSILRTLKRSRDRSKVVEGTPIIGARGWQALEEAVRAALK